MNTNDPVQTSPKPDATPQMLSPPEDNSNNNDNDNDNNDNNDDVVFRFLSTRNEADVDGVFLAAKQNATLGPAAARSVTDFHCTGSLCSESALVAEKATEINITLSKDSYTLSEDRKTMKLSDRTRLNVTSSRTAVAVDGTIGRIMSGQVSVALDEAFAQDNKGVGYNINLVYANWADISCVVQVSKPQIIDSRTGISIPNIEFVVQQETDEACQSAETILEAVYNSGMQTREVVIFEPAPSLTKTVMRVPFGINGSTFDFSCNVVDRPPSLSRRTFESIANAVMLSELSMDANEVDLMKTQCSSPSIDATKWASNVANCMSTIVNLCCPYRVDGVTKLLPDGISLVAAESWKAEASRDELRMMDDCDGSAALVSSQLYDAIHVARSKDLSQRFPMVAAFANAMAHHSVGVCVLSANAGKADDAGKDGKQAVAGHAIALAIPKTDMLTALVTGLVATLQEKPHDATTDALEDLAPKWANGLYHAKDIERMPVEERAVLQSYDRLMKMSERLPDDAGFVPLSMEGTSPVSPSTLAPKDDLDRLKRKKLGKLDKEVESMLGPSVTRNVTQLDVDPNSDDHIFYKEFVEILFPLRHNPMFENRDIRERGFATGQFVFTNATNPRRAGVSPNATASRSYALLPVWKMNTTEANVVDVAIAEAFSNAMPMRNARKGTVLNARDATTHAHNIKSLSDLNTSKVGSSLASHSSDDDKHVVQHIVPFATLMGNAHAIDTFVSRIKSLKNVDAFVDVVDAPGILTDVDGNDIGKFVSVNIAAAV